MIFRSASAAFVLAGSLCLCAWLSAPALAEPACTTPAQWLNPDDGTALRHDALVEAMAREQVVLLGESHDSAEDHRWQLQTIVALHGRHPDMVLGFEMFPRSSQAVLDRWIDGELSERGFVEAVEWFRIWGFEPALYMPIFHFARQNRVPMIALNVERSLIAEVGRSGWAAVPMERREGVEEPAPAPEGYRDRLAKVYRQKSEDSRQSDQAMRESDDFQNFVAAQLTWDRAMAEALAAKAGSGRDGGPLLVGLVGRFHAAYRYGVPHQLGALGIDSVGVLLTATPEDACADLGADIADAVFVLPDWQEAESYRPLLGVRIENADPGARIMAVSEGSVAEVAGLKTGDRIVAAAGEDLATINDLIRIVRRQASGTWLPLTIARDLERIEVIAKFPVAP